MMKADTLTPRQQRFIDEYLIDLNGTQAAIRAGYSEKTANEQAVRLLANISIQNAVEAGKQAKAQRAKLDADYLLQRLRDIDEMDALDILEEDGSIKPIKQWPKIWRQMISGMDVMNNPDTGVMLKRIKWPDKIRNLELIGRHIGVGAFQDKIELSGILRKRKNRDNHAASQ